MVESKDTSTHLMASSMRGVGRDHAVDDGLAVLGFADLEVGRFRRRLDEVAFGIDQEQALGSPAIWPPTMKLALASTLFCIR
jgi:hypothetical protein